MARIETKSIQVSPDHEQETIEIYEKFGWTCASSQTVESNRSYLERDERDSDVINQVTERTTYVKLVFKRDRDMENYQEIVKCEQAYQNHLATMPQKSILASIMLKVGVGIVLFGICGIFAKVALFGIFLIALGIAVVYCGLRRSAKRTEEIEKWNKKANKIFKKASEYI